MAVAVAGNWQMAAEMIRARRESLGLEQQDVARVSGIEAAYLSQLESGKRRAGPEIAAKLARALGLDPRILLVAYGYQELLDLLGEPKLALAPESMTLARISEDLPQEIRGTLLALARTLHRSFAVAPTGTPTARLTPEAQAA